MKMSVIVKVAKYSQLSTFWHMDGKAEYPGPHWVNGGLLTSSAL